MCKTRAKRKYKRNNLEQTFKKRYALVKFTDGIYHVAPTNHIKNRKFMDASVQWKNSWYLATILDESDDKKYLLKLKNGFEEEMVTGMEPHTEQNSDVGSFEKDLSIENYILEGNDSIKTVTAMEPHTEQNSDVGSFEEDVSIENYILEGNDLISESEIQDISISNIFPSESERSNKNISNSYDDTLQNELLAQQLDENTTTKSTNSKSNEISSNLPNCNTLQTTEIANKLKKSYPVKNQYCLYCEKLVTRFGRHLLGVHKLEADVKLILELPKKSIQRKKMIDTIRTKGSFIYNQQHEDNQIVMRRPIYKPTPKKYADCPSCFARVSKVSLRRHFIKCKPTNCRNNDRSTYVASKRLTLNLHPLADEVLKLHIFPVFRNTECVDLLRHDYLTILYGNKLVAKYRAAHHYKMIRSNIRLIGRFLLAMKNISNEISDFASCFKPRQYDNVVLAIRSVAGFNSVEGEFRAPNTASTLGTLLKFCSAILESDYIKKNNEDQRKEVESFLKLLRTELPTDINKTATENQSSIRRQKKVVLPARSDMKKFVFYLRTKRDYYFKKIKENFTFENWKNLAGYTLVGILVFNGRRPGEIERITISDFKNSAQSLEERPELRDQLNGETGDRAQYVRCLIRGKLCSNVSVMLHENEVDCINLTLEKRIIAGVDPNNPFIFGLPSSKPYKFINAAILLKKFAGEAKLEHPDRFFATNIRKNLATRSTNLQLHQEDREHIMHFMGHSEKIHKSIYRQPDVNKDILMMPRILNYVTGDAEEENNTVTPSITCVNSNDTLNSEKVSEESSLNSVLSLSNNTSQTVTCTDSDPEYKSPEDDDPDSSESELEIPVTRKRSRLIDMSLGYVPRKSWNTEEREAARSFFKDELILGETPTSDKCKHAMKVCKALQNRTPKQIKAWISNHIRENRKIKVVHKRTWRTPEKTICRKEFGEYVKKGVYPSRDKCKTIIKKYPELKNRTIEMVIGHLQHAIKKTTQADNSSSNP